MRLRRFEITWIETSYTERKRPYVVRCLWNPSVVQLQVREIRPARRNELDILTSYAYRLPFPS